MQVSLDLPLAALQGSLTDILSALTPEQKVQVSVSVLRQIMENPNADSEFMGSDAAALKYARDRANSWSRDRTNDELRRTDDYQMHFRDHTAKGPRQQMIRAMVDAAADVTEAEISRIVKESLEVKASIRIITEAVVSKVPELIQKALMLHLAGNLDQAISKGIITATLGIPTSHGEQQVISRVDVVSQISQVVSQLRTEADAAVVAAKLPPPTPHA